MICLNIDFETLLPKDLVFLLFQLIVLVVSKDDSFTPNADKNDQQ
jgi:hypothetical protein